MTRRIFVEVHHALDEEGFKMLVINLQEQEVVDITVNAEKLFENPKAAVKHFVIAAVNRHDLHQFQEQLLVVLDER